MKRFIVILLFVPFVSFAQTSRKDSIWQPMKFFLGTWTGTGEGEPGKGNYERTYKLILNNNFIEIKNKSTYPPTDKLPKGEVHEDLGFLSYDKGRKKFMLRQFHTESFVNTFILDSISPDKRTIVFITESIENIPKGFRAKETYKILNDNEMEEIFEIAEPNKEFEVYTKVKLFRQKK
ncbi:MAG: hypothetical protein QM737_15040 [Ferruginibacter sp.]